MLGENRSTRSDSNRFFVVHGCSGVSSLSFFSVFLAGIRRKKLQQRIGDGNLPIKNVCVLLLPNHRQKSLKVNLGGSCTPGATRTHNRRIRRCTVLCLHPETKSITSTQSTLGVKNSLLCLYLTQNLHHLHANCGRPFGRLINASPDATCYQEQVFSPWRFREPSNSGLVSFQGT